MTTTDSWAWYLVAKKADDLHPDRCEGRSIEEAVEIVMADWHRYLAPADVPETVFARLETETEWKKVRVEVRDPQFTATVEEES